MMKFVVCLAVLVVVVVVVVVAADLDAKLPKGEKKSRRRRPLPPPPTPQVLSDTDTDLNPPVLSTPPGSSPHLPPGHAVVSWWEEKVPGKPGAIKEGGFSSVNEQVVAVGVFGRKLLKKFGYVGATILYDFSQDNPLSAVRVRQPQTCFLMPVKDGLKFEDAAATLVARNNTATTIPRSVVFRDVRGDKQLSEDDVTALNGTNRAVVTFCGGLPIYKTKSAKEKNLPKDRQITVVGLDELVTLAIPQAANADAFSLEPAKLDSSGLLGQGTGRVQRKKSSQDSQSAAAAKPSDSSGKDAGKVAKDKGDKAGEGKSAQDKGDKAGEGKSAQDKGDKAGASRSAQDKGDKAGKGKSAQDKGDKAGNDGKGDKDKGGNKGKSGQGKGDKKGKTIGKDKKSGKGESGKGKSGKKKGE